jgi:hypothetical protein
MFVEALVIITTGQIKTIWHGQYLCWTRQKINTDLISRCGLFSQYTPLTAMVFAQCLFQMILADDGSFPLLHPLQQQQGYDGVSYSELSEPWFAVTLEPRATLIGRKKVGTLTSCS